MPVFVKLATINDIPENEVRAFDFEGELIAIYNRGGTFYATTDICTHAYSELHEGYFDVDECVIECPLHGARFDIQTGAVLALPAFAPLETYPVRIEGEDILVGL